MTVRVLNLLHRLIGGNPIGVPEIHCPAVHVYMHERGHTTDIGYARRHSSRRTDQHWVKPLTCC
jgi:hypothetical protein